MGLILVIIAGVLSMAAQMYVQSSYQKYARIGTYKNMTGAQVAKYILDANNITDVVITQSSGGTLSDHFDPSKKVVALSRDVYHGTSIASVAVAAHEIGHAIQYDKGYAGIAIRNALLKPALVANQMAGLFIMLGFLFINGSMGWMFDVGIIMLIVITAFQILTLPIEFDASNRALKNIQGLNILESNEYEGAKTMLTAAALTYVAAAVGSIMNLLRFIMIRNDRRN